MTDKDKTTQEKPVSGDKTVSDTAGETGGGDAQGKVPEVGGRGGLDPVRYGDWEIGGRCVDF